MCFTAPCRRRLRAFTLVELLVVIGIIAALIGILLPVLSGVSARGRDLKCQANLRSIVQLFMTYAAENKGSVMYGWHWEKFDPMTGQQLSGNNNSFVSWASIITKMSRGKGGQIEDGDISSPYNGPFLKCPEASLSQNQLVTYVVNLVAMPGPYDNITTMGGPAPCIPPAKLNGMFPHNALVWDTPVLPNSDENVGYLTGADVDDVQRLWAGIAFRPQWAFFDPRDVYGNIPPGLLGNNKPVRFPASWKNIDPTSPSYPYQGNLRFRHNKNTSCNVGFADGSVRAFTAKLNSDKSMKSHDAIRKNFLLRWPSGVRRDPAAP
jgi:prepilin-type processing-associated H-X9-DG protein